MKSRGLKALLGYLWNYRWQTGIGVLGLILADAAQLGIPFLSQRVIDDLHEGPNRTIIALIVCLAFIAYGARCLWRFCLFGAARKCDIEIRRQIYDRAVHLDLTYHSNSSIGHMMALATSDVAAVRMALAFALMSSFDAVIYSILSITALLRIDAGLAMVTLLPFPLLGFLMRYLMKWNYQTWDRVQQNIDELTEKSRESISGMRVLRTLVQNEGDAADFRRITAEQYRRFMTFVKVDGVYSPTILFLSGISSALLLAVGGQHVVDGKLTVGEFTAFASFLGQLSWPMVAAGWTLSLVQRGTASMDRILTLLDALPEPQQPTLSETFSGSLEIRDLTFTYPGGVRPALCGLSARVAAGGSLGLVGEVGSGKSTLTRLMQRLFEPQAGSIFLDGHDVTTLNLSQLRQQFSWVEQESFLFSATIEENLRLSGFEGDVQEAARAAELHQEVLSFPEGYQTLLGERGVTLSGGQRQRLCLARALLKPAPVLLLDDTLSAVDADTEQRILSSLAGLRGRQTLLIISHRVSSVRDCDEILVLEEGSVVQRGRHEQLLEQEGLYRRLYELQTT
ncbi:MAG: ABC transporter ATP-binding protein [Candidatus Eremiobacteraeota bacterium]|nr:ABC transporter ATP-binding protein [Candidatus Eremiobacteraeota bacterium]